jgi:hypothetical protein
VPRIYWVNYVVYRVYHNDISIRKLQFWHVNMLRFFASMQNVFSKFLSNFSKCMRLLLVAAFLENIRHREFAVTTKFRDRGAIFGWELANAEPGLIGRLLWPRKVPRKRFSFPMSWNWDIFMGTNTFDSNTLSSNPKSSRSVDPQFFHKLLFYIH